LGAARIDERERAFDHEGSVGAQADGDVGHGWWSVVRFSL
jgi:hypothetical protein